MRRQRTEESLKITNDDICIVNDIAFLRMSGAMKKLRCGRNYFFKCIQDGSLEVFIHPEGTLVHPDAINECIIRHTINGNGKMALPKKKK